MRADVIELSLGLEGFRVIGTNEDPDGVEIVIERNDAAGVCPDCNTISALVHDGSTVALPGSSPPPPGPIVRARGQVASDGAVSAGHLPPLQRHERGRNLVGQEGGEIEESLGAAE